VMLRPEDGIFPLIQEKMVVVAPEAVMAITEAELQVAPPKLNLWAEFSDALQRTFRVKPWVTLSSLWVILLVLGWMATAEIISPGNDQPKPRTPVAEAQREQSSSLGVLGAIGFSCATISIVLAQKFGQDRRR
jgi:p-aminobenzoyl-glutamate transporter AbgT